MTPLTRRLLNLLAVLSAALGVAGAAAWPASYESSRTLSFGYDDPAGRRTSLSLMLTRGVLVAGVRRWVPPANRRLNPDEQRGLRYMIDLPWTMPWGPIGLSVGRTPSGAAASAPLWLVVPLAVAPGAVLAGARLRRRGRKHRKGCCAGCDYDLTGNQSGVCPECGAAVAAGR